MAIHESINHVCESTNIPSNKHYLKLAICLFRHIEFTTPTDERERLVKRLVSLYDSGDDAELLSGVQAVLDAKQTDVIHDLLAHLAQQMIDLNQQKQAETRRWLGWLEVGSENRAGQERQNRDRRAVGQDDDSGAIWAITRRAKAKPRSRTSTACCSRTRGS